MRKTLTILLCAALAAAGITIIALSSQRGGLTGELESARRSIVTLKASLTQYKEEKEALTKERDATVAANALLETERDALLQEKVELTDALVKARADAADIAGAKALAEQTLSAAQAEAEASLMKAQAEWTAERNDLTAAKEAAEDRLSEALAILLGSSPTTEDAADPQDALSPEDVPAPAPTPGV